MKRWLVFIPTLFLVLGGCGDGEDAATGELVVTLDDKRAEQFEQFATAVEKQCGALTTIPLKEGVPEQDPSFPSVTFELTQQQEGQVELRVAHCPPSNTQQTIALPNGQVGSPLHGMQVFTYLDGQPADPEGDVLICTSLINSGNGFVTHAQGQNATRLKIHGTKQGRFCWQLQLSEEIQDQKKSQEAQLLKTSFLKGATNWFLIFWFAKNR